MGKYVTHLDAVTRSSWLISGEQGATWFFGGSRDCSVSISDGKQAQMRAFRDLDDNIHVNA